MITTLAPVSFPKTFSWSRMAPTRRELRWFHDYLSEMRNGKAWKVLEFGCGISTWAINDALQPDIYLAIEAYEPSMQEVSKHCPNVILKKKWGPIKQRRWNFIFVDSSAGYRNLHPVPGLFRRECIRFAEKSMTPDCLVSIHDWRHRLYSKRARRYLERSGYELVNSFTGRTGIGVYRRGGKQ